MEIAALYHQGRITLRRDLGTSGPATVLGATSMILRWWVERPSWEERGDGGMRDFHCCPLWDQRSDETRSCRVFLCFFCFKRFCFQALKGGVSRLSRGRSSPTRSARGRCVLQWKLSRPMGHLPIAGLPGTLGFGSTLFWRGTWLSSTGRTYRSLHDLDVLGFEWAKHIACLCFSTTRVLILSFFHIFSWITWKFDLRCNLHCDDCAHFVHVITCDGITISYAFNLHYTDYTYTIIYVDLKYCVVESVWRSEGEGLPTWNHARTLGSGSHPRSEVQTPGEVKTWTYSVYLYSNTRNMKVESCSSEGVLWSLGVGNMSNAIGFRRIPLVTGMRWQHWRTWSCDTR